MKIIIDGDPKEIAALIQELQERQVIDKVENLDLDGSGVQLGEETSDEEQRINFYAMLNALRIQTCPKYRASLRRSEDNMRFTRTSTQN